MSENLEGQSDLVDDVAVELIKSRDDKDLTLIAVVKDVVKFYNVRERFFWGTFF